MAERDPRVLAAARVLHDLDHPTTDGLGAGFEALPALERETYLSRAKLVIAAVDAVTPTH